MNTKELQKSFDKGERLVFDRPTVILASNSPRRAKLLDEAGIKYIKIVGGTDEEEIHKKFRHDNVGKAYTKKYVKALALAKLTPFIEKVENGAVVTADTVIWCRSRILEKPYTKEKCREQHQLISGKINYAITAIAVHFNGKLKCVVKCTPNAISPLPDDIIEQICNEPYTLECAGFRSSGAIAQYARVKEKHRQNLIGLDVPMLIKMLKKQGFCGI